jgi:hypothetical protein
MIRTLTIDYGVTGRAMNLRARLYDASAVAIGALISTGFAEIGTSGVYQWTYDVPDTARSVILTDTADADTQIVNGYDPADALGITAEEIATASATAVQAILADEFAAIPDTTEIAAAVQTQLADDFDALPTAAENAAQVDTVLTAAHGAGSWQEGEGGGGVDPGDVAVDHNYDLDGSGDQDQLRVEGVGGDGLGDVRVIAYLTADVAAGSYEVQDETTTLADGRWKVPLYLSTGISHTLHFRSADRRVLLGTKVFTPEA